MLFLGANNSKFFGIDYESGKFHWVTDLDGAIKSTPVLVGNKIFSSTRGGSLYSLDSLTGKILWRSILATSSQVSPLYIPSNNSVLISDLSGNFSSIDANTGVKNWNFKARAVDKMMTSPILVETLKESLILAYCGNFEMCFLKMNGKVHTRFSISGELTSVPYITNNEIIFSYDNGGIEVFSIQ